MSLTDTFDNPQSRVEAILQNAMGAEHEVVPQSRVEELLERLDGYLENIEGKITDQDEEIIAAVNAWLEDNFSGDYSVTDKTLAVSGMPSDSKTVGDELFAYTGNKPIVFTDKRYVATSGDTTDFVMKTGNSYRCAIVDCGEGDEFTINGQGAASSSGQARLWAFATSDGTILSKAEAKASAANLIIVAPEGSAKLVINDTTNSSSYVGRVLVEAVRGLGSKIDGINNKIGPLTDDTVDITSYYAVLADGKMSPRINNTYALEGNTKLTHIEVPIGDVRKFQIKIRQYASTPPDSYIAGVDSNDVIVYLNEPENISTTQYVTYRVEIPAGVSKLYITSYSGSIEITKLVPRTIQKQIDDLTDTVAKAAMNNEPRMQFAAHRGARAYAPEDSIAAFEIAGKMGFAWAWIAAVQQSADGTFYVMHDSTVDRTTDGSGEISSMTDAQINALRIDYEPSGVNYHISDFSDEELHIPTLDEVIQVCLRYNMKMCFRMNCLPYYNTDPADLAKWDAFINLIKEYALGKTGIFSGGMRQLDILRGLVGEEWEVNSFVSETTSASEYVSLFAEHPALTNNRSCILGASQANAAAIRLLHKNNIKTYVVFNSPTAEDLENCARWGVDILVNPFAYRLL